MILEELFEVLKTLTPYINFESKEIDALINSANKVGKSWSGSWIGYHANVYYDGFIVPPAGKIFSSEWGLMDVIYDEVSHGDWKEFSFDDVINYIYTQAKNPDIKNLRVLSNKAIDVFEDAKMKTLSKISVFNKLEKDKFIDDLVRKINSKQIIIKEDFINYSKPTKYMSRDTTAIHQGTFVPPHIDVLADMDAIKNPFDNCKSLNKIIINICDHIKDIKKLIGTEKQKCTRVINPNQIFIVHGHDIGATEKVTRFIEKLKLKPIVLKEQASSGKTIVEKIEEHAEKVCFGIVIYTPCDIGKLKDSPDSDYKNRARQNVVFEHGFLNGKIGRKNVVALIKDDIEIPNDLNGVVYIDMDNDNAWHLKIAKEMKNSGINIDLNKLIE